MSCLHTYEYRLTTKSRCEGSTKSKSLPKCFASSSYWQAVVSAIKKTREGSDSPLDVQSSESKFGITINGTDKTSVQQTVMFSDQNSAFSYNVDSMPDSTFDQATKNDVTLDDFFARPIKINSFNWAVGNLFYERFNPWTAYFTNPRIINRISNYSLLRAKLHIKIILNGNGFHYGRAMASYLPLHTRDDLTVDRAFFQQDLVQASQRPHVFLDPTSSQGGDMTLPFFFPKNALSIPQAEWTDMGELTLQSLNDLKHANGATDNVTVSIFAWAEDLTISMPTASNAGSLVSQSFEEPLDCQADEYGSNPISAPASLIARWAGALKDAPIIGPYARATSIAASGVSNIAKIFGYSRPAVISDIQSYKPTFVGNIANTNMPDTVQKLSLDTKQEVTIDPRTTGLGCADEMAIVPLAMRESYITTFPWTVPTLEETLLWNSEVTPNQLAVNTIGGDDELHMSPSCWVATPFEYWRGSMEFRFQIISSNYHKGRLKVVWDPYYPTTNEYNTNYTWIIDIAEEKDFSVQVGWGNQLSYLRHSKPSVNNIPYSISKILPNTAIPERSNGILSVYVVNELTIPNSTINNDIEINVFTKMCSDFELAAPDSTNLETYAFFPSPLTTQSAEESMEEEANEAVRPISEGTDAVFGLFELDSADHSLDVYFGEQIVSIRQLLKRYDYFGGFKSPGTNGPVTDPGYSYQKYLNNVPYLRGFAPNAIDKVDNGSNPDISYNRCKMTHLNWFLPAYVGYRGAMRWKYVKGIEIANNMRHSSMTVNRSGLSTLGVTEIVSPVTTDDVDINVYKSQILAAKHSTWDGASITTTETNPVLEIELPWYSNYRFGFCKSADFTSGLDWQQFHELQTYVTKRSACFDSYVSVGEDFSLYFFTGAPIAYKVGRNDPPPPS